MNGGLKDLEAQPSQTDASSKTLKDRIIVTQINLDSAACAQG